MDKDRIIGAAKQVMGRLMRTLGQAVGDSKLQVDGTAEQTTGKVQNLAGSAKDTLKD